MSYSSLCCSQALRGIESDCLDVTLLSCGRLVFVMVKMDVGAAKAASVTFPLCEALPLLSELLLPPPPPLAANGDVAVVSPMPLLIKRLLGERTNALWILPRCLDSWTACSSVRPE